MRLYLFSMVFLALAFVGCQEKKVDVKKDQLSHKTSDYNISVERSVFSSTDEALNKSCQVLNKATEALVQELSESLKKEATDLFQDMAAQEMERPSWQYELWVDDSVFMASSKYISVRLRTYTFTGGAHGMTKFYTFNYDVEQQKMLKNEEILDFAKSDVIDAQLEANFQNSENCFSEKPTLKLANGVNISSTGVVFTYEQYVLGAYACGVAEVTVPRAALKDALLVR